VRVHIVQKGDTLWKIAKQYAVGFEELKRLNAHLTNPDYIVPGMEIYLPDAMHNKEVKKTTVVKEQQVAPVKEQVKPVKEHPIVKGPEPQQQPIQRQPIWQGDIYLQQPPQPQPLPTPVPNLQNTQIHFQPTIEQSMVAPAQQPMPMPMPMPMPQMIPQQPIFIQQPVPVPTPVPVPQQPIFIEKPIMQPMPMPQQPMHPIPICSCCKGVKMDHHMQHHMQHHMHHPMQHHMQHPMQYPMQEFPMQEFPMNPIQTLPANVDESSEMQVQPCNDRQQKVEDYYNQIHHMMMMPQPCCPPMMPYPMQMMPQMNPTHQQPRSCH
jgi:morphogenetic protein associated with SpoVID